MMDDDSEFIPRSARMVNFGFRVTKVVENSLEFLAIKADTDTLVLEFKLALKQQVMKKNNNWMQDSTSRTLRTPMY